MKTLFLDLYPAYIPMLVQCTKAAGDKVNPTVDNLIIYEEGGADGTFDSGTIAGSPFDPVQINAKTGLWGILVAKTAFTAGKFYVALWEMTVDGVTTAKVERYFACNAASFKATGFSTFDPAVSTVILNESQGSYAPAKAGDAMTVSDKTGFALTNDYDAAKTAASATNLSDLAGKFTGITALANWLRALLRKDTADTTAKTEINAAGGSFDEATDSLQAASEQSAQTLNRVSNLNVSSKVQSTLVDTLQAAFLRS